MAHRFISEIYDITEIKHTIEFFREGGNLDEIYMIPYASPGFPILSHRGNDKDSWDDEVIIASEFTHEIFLPKEEIALIEELAASAGEPYIVLHTISSGSTVLFRGLMKPENMVFDFLGNPNYIKLTITATDGLSDLKNVEFRNNDVSKSIVFGRKRLLDIIRLAIRPIDKIQNIAYGAYVVLNTYETTLMTEGDCALDKMYANCERFHIKTDDGFEVMTCFEVIEAVLKPFNCKMYKKGDNFYILNHNEYFYETHLTHIFTGTDWQIHSTSYLGFIQNLTDFLYIPGIERQLIQPVSTIHTLFKNEDMGGNVTGDDLMALATYTHDFYSAVKTVEGYMQFTSQHNPSNREDTLRLASDFSVVDIGGDLGEACYLRIEMEYRIQFPVYPDGVVGAMEIGIRLNRPDIGWTPVILKAPLYGTDWIRFDSGAYAVLEILKTGYYNIEFVFRPVEYQYWDWTMLTVQIRSMRITTHYYGDIKDYDPISINLNEEFYQTSQFNIGTIEEEIILADGNQITEKGALMDVDNTLSVSWNRYQLNDEAKLADIYTRNILINRSMYKNFLRLSFIDRDMATTMLNKFVIMSSNLERMYAFASYTKNWHTGQIEAEAIEIKLEDVSPPYYY